MSIHEDKLTSSLQQYEGTPRKRGRRGELKRFQGFRTWIKSWFHRSEDLTAEFAVAKVKEADAEAEIKQQQAAEIAARTDLIRNKSTKSYFDLVDAGIGSADPELAQDLKLAKLLEENPDVMEQVAKIRAIREKLAAKHGVRVEIVDEQPKQLTDQRGMTSAGDLPADNDELSDE